MEEGEEFKNCNKWKKPKGVEEAQVSFNKIFFFSPCLVSGKTWQKNMQVRVLKFIWSAIALSSFWNLSDSSTKKKNKRFLCRLFSRAALSSEKLLSLSSPALRFRFFDSLFSLRLFPEKISKEVKGCVFCFFICSLKKKKGKFVCLNWRRCSLGLFLNGLYSQTVKSSDFL